MFHLVACQMHRTLVEEQVVVSRWKDRLESHVEIANMNEVGSSRRSSLLAF
jgi:hypothetical protein